MLLHACVVLRMQAQLGGVDEEQESADNGIRIFCTMLWCMQVFYVDVCVFSAGGYDKAKVQEGKEPKGAGLRQSTSGDDPISPHPTASNDLRANIRLNTNRMCNKCSL